MKRRKRRKRIKLCEKCTSCPKQSLLLLLPLAMLPLTPFLTGLKFPPLCSFNIIQHSSRLIMFSLIVCQTLSLFPTFSEGIASEPLPCGVAYSSALQASAHMWPLCGVNTDLHSQFFVSYGATKASIGKSLHPHLVAVKIRESTMLIYLRWNP